jgi:hypothetical protein
VGVCRWGKAVDLVALLGIVFMYLLLYVLARGGGGGGGLSSATGFAMELLGDGVCWLCPCGLL